MEHFEKFDKQLISSYETVLAIEGEEICKEVDSLNQDDHELLIEKAKAYCLFVLIQKENLISKLDVFLNSMNNFITIFQCFFYYEMLFCNIHKEFLHQPYIYE